MATIETRLAKLESLTNINAKQGTEMVLAALLADGFDDLSIALAQHDESEGHTPMPFWSLMHLMRDGRNPFEFERYRGLVPDDVIRRAYKHQRNYAFGNESIVTRVRQLAGVIGADGNVMPGYVLLDNGCIVDAPNESSTV